MRLACLLTLLAGCGFEHGVVPGTGSNDAAVDGDSDARVIDAAPPTACINKWLDGTVRLGSFTDLGLVNTSSIERDPFLSPDELTIYFSSYRTGSINGDVYTATRASKSAAFGNPAKFAAASTDGTDSKLSMTSDGLYLVISTTKNGTSGSNDMHDASRASTTDPFSTPGNTFTGLANTGADEVDSFVTRDGLDLYFARTVNGLQRVAHSSRVSRSVPFTSGAVIAELDSGAGDADPTVSSDGRVIIFSSNRPTTDASSSNIWYATRSSSTGTFGTPKPVPDINGDSAEGDPWLSEDGCRLYFASDRDDDYDLWTSAVQ